MKPQLEPLPLSIDEEEKNNPENEKENNSEDEEEGTSSHGAMHYDDEIKVRGSALLLVVSYKTLIIFS